MKKFILGVFVGAFLFSGISVFAESVKTLVGEKVTGVYEIEQGGKKIAEGAVINGSTYVPIRTIANATGTPLTVEGKKITLPVLTSVNEGNALSDAELKLVDAISKQKGVILGLEGFIGADNGNAKHYEDAIAEEKAKAEKLPGRLEALEANLAKTKARIAEYQTQITAAEAEIARLQALLDASKK
ncbi:hypothetical protein NQ117_05200 [Paenibacillus sp. SC116]|uniref:hypothetical protein n=1 Tax=Paenibacillus sp. SC116 TaxID=2968986 RepID=UPI00215A3263|nr:hypothetical protein [Paenibacillus sp. SC116]MCR8843068.1 hypothetical protein [Paenibacillus sp. SC116]